MSVSALPKAFVGCGGSLLADRFDADLPKAVLGGGIRLEW